MNEAGSKALAAALEALARGWRPIPITAGKKKPPLIRWSGFQRQAPTEEQARGWFEKWPDANVAILTGRASGIDIIDFDPGHEPWPLNGDELPVDCVISTPRGGWHYYILHTLGVRCSTSKLARKVDVRGDGGYVLLPPSEVNGKPYYWSYGGPNDLADAAPPSAWLRAALLEASRNGGARGKKPAATRRPRPSAGEMIPEGRRNCTLTSMGGSMRYAGFGERAILAALGEHNQARCGPPLPDREVREITRSMAKYPPEQGRALLAASRMPLVVWDALPELSPLAFKAAAALSGFMNGRGECFPSLAAIGKKMGVPRSKTVTKALHELNRRGLLHIIRRRRQSNLYRWRETPPLGSSAGRKVPYQGGTAAGSSCP